MPDRTFDILIELSTKVDELNKGVDGLKQFVAQANQAGSSLTGAQNSASGLAAALTKSGSAAGVLSGLLGTLGFTGVLGAALALVNSIKQASEQSHAFVKEVQDISGEVRGLAAKWVEAAQAAGTYGEAISLGKGFEGPLDALTAKLEQVKATYISSTQAVVNFIDAAADWKKVGGTQEQQELTTATIEKQLKALLFDANGALQLARQAAEAWQAVKLEPLNQAVDEYTAKLAKLKQEQAAIDPTKSIAEYKAYVSLGDQIVYNTDRLKELTDAQAKFATETEKVDRAINDLNFSKLAPTDQLPLLKNDLAAIEDELQALGQMGPLTREQGEEVVRLKGQWLEVTKAILSVISAIEKANRAALEAGVATAIAFEKFETDLANKTRIAQAELAGDKIGVLNAQLDKQKADLLAQIPAGALNYDEEAAKVERYIEAERQLGIQQLQNRDATHAESDAHRDLSALLRTETDLLKDLKAQEQLINDNPANSPDDKQTALHNLFIQQQEEVANKIDELRAKQSDPAIYGDPGKIEQVREAIRGLTTDYVELEFKIQTTSFTGAVGDELLQWVNSFGSTAHQVAQIITGTLNTAIQGTSSAITGLIFGTQNWRQAFASVAQSIVQNLIQIGLQILIQQTVGAAIRRAFAASELAATKGEAAAAHSAWAPAAIAASIATDGAAAVAGLLAYFGAEAAGTAASFIPGFHEGGVVGFGDTPGFHSGGLTKQERLVRALVGEGFFLPHQMAAMMALPGKEHLFKPDQLAALNNGPIGVSTSGGGSGEGHGGGFGGGPNPGGFEVEPGQLPGTGNYPPPQVGPPSVTIPGGGGTPYNQPHVGADYYDSPYNQPHGGIDYYDSPQFRFNPTARDPSDWGNYVLPTGVGGGYPRFGPSAGGLWYDNATGQFHFGPSSGGSWYDNATGNERIINPNNVNIWDDTSGWRDNATHHPGRPGSPYGAYGGIGALSFLSGNAFVGGTSIIHPGPGNWSGVGPVDLQGQANRYHEGGIVPIDAHTGEGILSAGAMSAIGPEMFHAINNLTFDVHRPTFHEGGIIGGDSASPSGSGGLSLGGVEVHNFISFDPDKLFAMMRDSSAAKKSFIDILNDR